MCERFGRGPNAGNRKRLEHQPHAKQIIHASEPEMWSPDTSKDALPIAGDEERTLPNARRHSARRPAGK